MITISNYGLFNIIKYLEYLKTRKKKSFKIN